MVQPKEEPKAGPPAYMVSFGDMMTLILTFFILLVSMSVEQQAGLMAKGLGSFVVALESHGLDGMMSSSEKLEIFDEMRRKFNVPEEEDPERAVDHQDASSFELIQNKVLDSLRPHHELGQPSIAVFDRGSAELTQSSKTYIDRLVASIRPRSGQMLLLEGHSSDAGTEYSNDNAWLAYARADAVRRYLVEEHGVREKRIAARAWLREVEADGTGTRSVDARLITSQSDKGR